MSDPSQQNAQSMLIVAMGRSVESLMQAKEMAAAGWLNAAYVWAVRSVEIFLREFCLAPAYRSLGQSFDQSMKNAERSVGGGNWVKAFNELERLVGPLDPMLTEDGDNVIAVWKRRAPERRGHLVHGNPVGSVEPAEMETILQWCEQLRVQVGLRLLITEGHPANEPLRGLFEVRPAT